LRDLKSKLGDAETAKDKYRTEVEEWGEMSEKLRQQLEEQKEFLRQMDKERDIVQADLDGKAELILDLQGLT
jgi:hypothetical protein